MNKIIHWKGGTRVPIFSKITFISRLGGVAGLLGLALALLQVSRLAAPLPAIAKLLQVLPNLTVLLWLLGIYAFQSPRLGGLGKTGLGAAMTGLSGIILLNLLQQAAATNPEDWIRTLFASPALPWVLTVIAVLFIWGVLALGTASLRAGVLPRMAVVLWMVAMMASLITSWLPVSLVTMIGVLWSSIVMMRGIPASEIVSKPEGNSVVPTTAETKSEAGRLIPIDALRGTIILLMAIDHASIFMRRWHPFETWDQPLPDYPSLAAMLTRLATHPCAPGFFFLMGAGMILFAHSRRQLGWSESIVAGNLALRGLLFIALEQLIVDVASSGKIYPLEFSILAGLGAVMLLGLLFLKLNGLIQAIVGVAILLLIQLIPGLLLHADLGIFSAIRLLVVPGSVGPFSILYAPLPWLGVTLLGMAFARCLLRDPERAYRMAGIAGLLSLILFLLVRLTGGFGNLRMPAGDSLIDFLNVVKYPPSLSFLFLSLGFDLVILYLFSRISTKHVSWAQPVVILGQAALFFFLAHWFVYNAMGMAWNQPGGLPQTYLAWAIGLILLYPVCKVYESFKHRMPATSAWRMV